MAIKGIHLNLEWNDNYADTSSIAFYKFAVKNEYLLFRLLTANNADEEIEGVKIIGARKGSVVLDVKIIYADTTTPKDAFNSFVKSITTKTLRTTIVHRMLNIRPDTTPTLFIHQIAQNNNAMPNIILLAVAVALSLVIVIFGIAYKMKQRRARSTVDDVTGYDNGGIETNEKC